MAYDILKTEDLVKHLLEKYPKTRDSDEKLISHFWNYECERLGLDKKDMLNNIYLNKLSQSKSIERSRRHVQKKHPELRGPKYLLRQRRLEHDVRKDMRNKDKHL